MSIAFFDENTMNEWGFSDFELKDLCEKDQDLQEKVQRLALAGFTYAGAPGGGSKAYTDVDRRKIYIAKDKTVEEALLSLSYEATNALNREKLFRINYEYLPDREGPSISRAHEYAYAILSVEAEAVCAKCLMAMKIQREDLILNPKYLLIVKENLFDKKSILDLLFREMLENGKVHKGKIKAVDYYVSQYFKFQKTE